MNRSMLKSILARIAPATLTLVFLIMALFAGRKLWIHNQVEP